MDNYLISIIVPIYNSEKFLDRCIKSIISQSYRNLEIILINDGSTDASPKICDIYREQDERIKVIHKRNKGVAIARNKGLDIATGDYIAFVDSDDYIQQTFCEILLKNAVRYDSDITQCGYYRVSEDENILSENKFNFEITEGSYSSSRYYLKGENTTNYVCNKLFSKKTIDGVKFPKVVVSEDFAFNVKAYYKCDRSLVISEALYYYVKNEDSVTNSKFNIDKLDSIKIGERMYYFHKNRYHDLCSFLSLYITNYVMKYYKEIYYSDINNKRIELSRMKNIFDKYSLLIKGKGLRYLFSRRKILFKIMLFKVHPQLYLYFIKMWNQLTGK